MAVLLGRTSVGVSTDFGAAGATDAWKFTAIQSGNVARIWAHTKVANATGVVQLGIYDDDAANARPGNLLGVATAANAAGTFPFSATLATLVPVVAGTAYWLAWRNSLENFDYLGDPAGSYIERTGVNFPNPFGAGGSAGSFNAAIWADDGTDQPPPQTHFLYQVRPRPGRRL